MRLLPRPGLSPFVIVAEPIELPVAHGEGKFLDGRTCRSGPPGTTGQIVLRYADDRGPADQDYPANPNGSAGAVAGLCDPTGRIFGLMPHPERFVDPWHHPRWTRRGELSRPKGTACGSSAAPSRSGSKIGFTAAKLFDELDNAPSIRLPPASKKSLCSAWSIQSVVTGPWRRRGQSFAHREGNDRIEAAVADQDRAGDPGDLVDAVEPVPEQERDRGEREHAPAHVDHAGECGEGDQPADLAARRQVDGDRPAQRPAGGDDLLGVDVARVETR